MGKQWARVAEAGLAHMPESFVSFRLPSGHGDWPFAQVECEQSIKGSPSPLSILESSLLSNWHVTLSLESLLHGFSHSIKARPLCAPSQMPLPLLPLSLQWPRRSSQSQTLLLSSAQLIQFPHAFAGWWLHPAQFSPWMSSSSQFCRNKPQSLKSMFQVGIQAVEKVHTFLQTEKTDSLATWHTQNSKPLCSEARQRKPELLSGSGYRELTCACDREWK